uniref:NR LBD domain-containing protein n=2 Tax=Caenorhabditis tropicalis TaxID=1561998 RepID=A0A1I7TP29_9PELO
MNLFKYPFRSSSLSRVQIQKCEEVGMNPMNIRAEITENGELLKAELLANQETTSVAFRAPLVIEDELSSAISKLTLIENRTDILFNSSMPKQYGDLRSLSDILQMNPILEISKIPNLTLLRNELFPVHAGFVHNTCLSIVEYTKMFGSFSQLTTYSIEKLIRHGSLMCGGLMSSRRSIQKFNSDSLRHTDGSLCGKPDRSWNGIYVEHKKMIHKTTYSFIRNRVDDVEFLFLKAIVMCNPAVPDLLDEDVKLVEKERFKYARWLLDYCLKKNGIVHGPDRFNSLLSMISLMEIQQKEQKCFHLILRSYFQEADFLVSPLYDDIMASH